VTPRIRVARWEWLHADSEVLDDLLDLIGRMHGASTALRRIAAQRRVWMSMLENLAVRVERDLPHALRVVDDQSQRAIAGRTRGTASALREMKHLIALPGETAWDDLLGQLRGLAAALAKGSFEVWPAALPVAAASVPRRPLWWRGMQAARTVLVIVGPPIFAFLVPLVAPVPGPVLAWLRSVTVVWALLAGVIALDPALGDRIAKMRDLLSLLRDATPPTTDASQAAGNLAGMEGGTAGESTRSQPAKGTGSNQHRPLPRHR
jgi:hypothetical protein